MENGEPVHRGSLGRLNIGHNREWVFIDGSIHAALLLQTLPKKEF